MLEWILAGVFFAMALLFVGAEYRLLDKKPDDPGLGFLAGIGLGVIAMICVQDWVIWGPIKWLDVRLQTVELFVRMLTIAVTMMVGGMAYMGALFGIGIGLSTLTRRRAVTT
ncbi:hypothetical protein RHOFW510R12_00935 [Rhodanobacter sp. FW510-R12]|uniref:hypothetical protein n=1 Tax=Rhodanobacter thiooxydans TaxID=416169 RepID=UPI00091BE792|nr:hypothetical protein [Rhodanobacter thiooxydans]UJJ56699.1 hypothetical protein LRK53_19000 [Rhodanobacter thiooxydans]